MRLTPATRLGSFEILGAIGAGGMGEFYRARDTRLNRDVAIKVPAAVFTEEDERLRRFTQEAQFLAQLHHPNIATVFGLEESNGGRPRDGAHRRSDLWRASAWADPARRGVADRGTDCRGARSGARARDRPPRPEAGQRQDQPDGNVKVLDFGLAKALDPTARRTLPASPLADSHGSRHTARDDFRLCRLYVPRAGARESGRPPADIWAFGVVLFEMLAGRRAFAGIRPRT